MNQLHHWLCRSAGWKKTLGWRVPWVLSTAKLGPHVLEAGPGPGLSTDRLRSAAPRLTVIGADQELVQLLRARLQGTNVEVVNGNATSMPFPDGEFSGCAAFTMLHDVPSPALQNKLLREVWRVLKLGGPFVGCDSVQNIFMRVLRLGDTFVPVCPDPLAHALKMSDSQLLRLRRVPAHSASTH